MQFLQPWIIFSDCLAGSRHGSVSQKFRVFPFTVQFACQLQTLYSGDSISQFPSSPSHWINTHHLSLLTKGFFFFLATPCSFYGSLVLGIKPGSSAVRAWSPNPLISREFPVYLQRALGELRGKKKKSSWLTQNILVQDIRKRVWKGDWKLNINFFFLLRENIPVKKHSIYLMINMYVHMQGVYINSCWGRK